MMKALKLQQELGPVFDLTCDCEDGAQAGAEAEHAQMVVEVVNGAENHFGRVGARIHDITHPHWQRDLEILVGGAGRRLAFVTIPKVRSAADAVEQIRELRRVETACGLERALPVHVLIETHGALREAWEIAALDGVESIDFGLMDFVSGHHGAIPGSAMKSPGPVRASAGRARQGRHRRRRARQRRRALAQRHHRAAGRRGDPPRRRAGPPRVRLPAHVEHPPQPDPADHRRRCSPTSPRSRRPRRSWCAAQDNAWGPIRHQGRLHDRASYRYYWELLQRARNTGMELPGRDPPALLRRRRPLSPGRGVQEGRPRRPDRARPAHPRAGARRTLPHASSASAVRREPPENPRAAARLALHGSPGRDGTAPPARPAPDSARARCAPTRAAPATAPPPARRQPDRSAWWPRARSARCAARSPPAGTARATPPAGRCRHRAGN